MNDKTRGEMKTQISAVPGFYWVSKAWWYTKYQYEDNEKIEIGFYFPGGGTSGYFTIEWVSRHNMKVPLLSVLDDAWNILITLPGIISSLSKLGANYDKHITPKELVNILMELGYKDLTDYEGPS